jgi:hypothetical protein
MVYLNKISAWKDLMQVNELSNKYSIYLNEEGSWTKQNKVSYRYFFLEWSSNLQPQRVPRLHAPFCWSWYLKCHISSSPFRAYFFLGHKHCIGSERPWFLPTMIEAILCEIFARTHRIELSFFMNVCIYFWSFLLLKGKDRERAIL